MRLFRQAEMGNWAPVIDELVMALQDWVREKLAETEDMPPTLSAMR